MRPTHLAVIGLGAVGGSLAWQALRAGIPRVVGYSLTPAEGVQAVQQGALTERADSLPRALRGADLVVLATPPAATVELLRRVARHLEPDAVVTDTASIKVAVLHAALEAGLADRFVGGHPLAGTHGSGFAAARPDRFRGAVVYLCHTGTEAGAVAAREVMHFWRATLEAEPVLMDAAAHDSQVAWTSHLPQVVASALGAVLAGRHLQGVSFGSGARDTTRLAASQPELWSQILHLNRRAVVESIDGFVEQLTALRQHVAAGDEARLLDTLRTAALFREGLDR